MLHPGLKLEYFWQQKWEPDWIQTAENIVREEYIDSYEGRVKTAATASSVAAVEDDEDGLDFGNISVTAKNLARLLEIDQYLQLPVEYVKDPLKWWYNNRALYPNLSRMALDYLSIPGKSNCMCHVYCN